MSDSGLKTTGSMADQVRQKAQGSTDCAFLMEAANHIERLVEARQLASSQADALLDRGMAMATEIEQLRTALTASEKPASVTAHTPAEATILVLERMSEFERGMFFEKLNARFCFNCGSADGRRCYCQRDD